MEQQRRRSMDPSTHRDSKKKDRLRPSHKSVYAKPSMYSYEPVSEFSVGQWNLRGQRLYPAMSDSAVCGYPFPNEFSMNPAFSMYPVLPPTLCSSMAFESGRRSSRYRVKSRAPDAETSTNNNANFTSLPPVNSEDVDCSQKRRFSDPGINNAEDSNESSSCESVSDEYSFVNETLVDQIKELKCENKRLCSELDSTKTELKIIKSEIAVIANKITCHEPFSLAQMVKEIRNAAELRENLLVSKVESLIEKCLSSKNMTSIVSEIDTLKKRLTLLERQLEHLRIHSKVESKMNGEATVEEIDNAAKRKNEMVDKIPKLRGDSDDRTKEIDCNSTTTTTTFDTNSEEVAESNSDCNGNSLSTMSCESLSSSLGPGSLHSATVTLCGPVTDL